jgi:hypothetical protein
MSSLSFQSQRVICNSFLRMVRFGLAHNRTDTDMAAEAAFLLSF